MKIITDNCVYVQKHDIAYLNQTDMPIPANILMKVFCNDINIVDDSNRYEFVKFEEPENINFFKSLDWIIDYNDVKELSTDELLKLGNSISEESKKIATKYNSMNRNYRKNNTHIIKQCDLLEFKLLEVRDFYLFKEGNIKFKLPDEIDYPSDCIPALNNVRKLIKSIFKRK